MGRQDHPHVTRHFSERASQLPTAIVTGSTSGIGAAIARTLAGEGARVLVSGRDKERGDSVVAEIVEAGGQATFAAVDLAGSYAEIRRFVAAALDDLGGRVDILVNSAGVCPATTTPELTDEDLDNALALNVRAPHVLVAALAPGMVAPGGGCIVNVSSWMGSVGVPFCALYSATKAADDQLTRSWSAEFGQAGIRVNAVAPGATLTPLNEASRDVLDHMTAGTPGGSVVLPQDIADGVSYLVSAQARMVHGITLYVDGGMNATRLR